MKKHSRAIVLFMSVIMISVCVAAGFAGCNLFNNSEFLNSLAEQIALGMIMGDDAFNWNTLFVNPEEAYGYVQNEDVEWYSYSRVSEDALQNNYNALVLYKNMLKNVNPAKLDARDMLTYRSLENTLNKYIDYYGSPYAKDFTLISGPYISSEGGYVAEFASAVENYNFRNESDVKILISITRSTDEAFATYLDYVRDRALAGYPLYDYTLNSMQEYLADILNFGENYYLYSFIGKKIDAMDVLSDSAKQQYKTDCDEALTNDFMKGVRELYNGLDAYKGRVPVTEKSYLAAYGNVGRAYYQWRFENLTGIRGANVREIYNEIVTVYEQYNASLIELIDSVNAFEETDKATYDEFYEYYNGERVYLGLTDPNEIIAYLKNAAKAIVPDLKAEPQIDFKYMDETVEQRTSTLAYYVMSPLDDVNSAEHITINGYQMKSDPSLLLTTIAHEGYPGHLYARVNAKRDISLITSLDSCLAFSEGWAKYVELAIIRQIAENSDSKAVKLYAQYDEMSILNNFLNALLMELEVNYFGDSVEDLIDNGYGEDTALNVVQAFMEIPGVYVPYGYGMYVINKMHAVAREELGDKYDEVEFNGHLLSDGFSPTLVRAAEIADNYITSKSV